MYAKTIFNEEVIFSPKGHLRNIVEFYDTFSYQSIYTRIISKYIYLSVFEEKFNCSNHLTYAFHSSSFLYKHSRVSVFACKLAT